MKATKAPSAAAKAPDAAKRRPGPDFGPTVRRVPEAAAAALPAGATRLQQRQARAAAVGVELARIVVKEDRPDPGQPSRILVRGSRVRDPLLMMFHMRAISKAQWVAAEAFRDDVALANGARVNQVDGAGVRGPMSGDNWPADARLAAMGRVSATWDRLGAPRQDVINAVVIEQQALGDYALHRRMRRERATVLLHAGLDELERCYRTRIETAS